ncbi:MAG: endonuclease/exonuclease/phosphatase family protein [Gemmatimonadetes bacterium]|nr:endonuclease/exonuclease/phosphatase family protein [Gemmatimonadota bacterium]
MSRDLFGFALGLAMAATAPLAACNRNAPTTPATPADTLAARIPVQGTATTLDVGSWNIEWFGDAGNGPSNEALQLTTVTSAITAMDLDIIGLQEVVGSAQFTELDTRLGAYAGILASDAIVAGGAASYTAGEQKVALLYKPSVATLTGARIVLASASNDFAGRPPLEATFRVTVNGTPRDVVVLVVHMKAFADAESWQRRTNAAIALKAYLDQAYPTQQVVVIGDFNDDVDTSISSGRPSPYSAFVGDVARYAFPTAALSLSRLPTTVGFTEAVDHHLATNELMATYVAGSARAVRLDQYITDYANVTSDHYPVVTAYR